MKPAVAAAVLSVALAPSGAARQQHAEPHVRAGGAAFAKDAPAELDVQRAKTGHLLVQAAIDGHEAGWFIFDTGAGICVLSTPKADELGLVAVGSLAANGTGGSATTQALVAETLELGPVTLSRVPLMKTDLSFLREHLGVEIAGVIGYGLFAECVVELDLVAPRIALHERAGFELHDAEWAPLELDDLIPTVGARVEGRETRLHLDIGSNSGIVFDDGAVKKWSLLEGREGLSDGKVGGVGGFIPVKKGRVATLELGGVVLRDVDSTFALASAGTDGPGHDGSLGVEVLRSFLMTLDYAGNRIALRPRPEGAAQGAPVTEK